jgi:hypothetical protein
MAKIQAQARPHARVPGIPSHFAQPDRLVDSLPHTHICMHPRAQQRGSLSGAAQTPGRLAHTDSYACPDWGGCPIPLAHAPVTAGPESASPVALSAARFPCDAAGCCLHTTRRGVCHPPSLRAPREPRARGIVVDNARRLPVYCPPTPCRQTKASSLWGVNTTRSVPMAPPFGERAVPTYPPTWLCPNARVGSPPSSPPHERRWWRAARRERKSPALCLSPAPQYCL